jgi:SAM-dependent methyltransferase
MSDDYRHSHIGKGADYDADLVNGAFDAHLSRWEHRHVHDLLRGELAPGPARCLDFACGTGRLTALLEQHAGDSVGVDISPSMLAVARQRCRRTRFVEADLTRTPLDLGRFDLICAFRFFGNAQDALRNEALAALMPMLAPGGRVLLDNHRNAGAVQARLDRWTGGNANGMDLNLPGLRRLLARHGLRITRLRPIGAWMWRSRLMHRPPSQDLADRRERWFGQSLWAGLAPASVVVAERV